MRCGLPRTVRRDWRGCTRQQPLLYEEERRTTVRQHDEDENFGDNYFIIFNGDLVRDQDEVVYIYAT